MYRPFQRKVTLPASVHSIHRDRYLCLAFIFLQKNLLLQCSYEREDRAVLIRLENAINTIKTIDLYSGLQGKCTERERIGVAEVNQRRFQGSEGFFFFD